MSASKFCVIGLGFFGEYLVKHLCKQGAEVVAIDSNTDMLAKVKDIVAVAVESDSTKERNLRDLDLETMDAVIVAIGENFEASLVTTALLKQLGVRRVITRVLSPIHGQLLKALGVSEMLVPESEAADHLAKRLMLPGVIESFRIGSEHSVFEVQIPQWMISRTVSEVQLRQKFALNIVTVKRKVQSLGINTQNKLDELTIIGTPGPDMPFQEGDILVLFGKEKDFADFMKA